MQPLERADVVALLTGVPRRQSLRTIVIGDYYVDHMCRYPESSTLTWVKRNEDKPHRCPCCHAVSIRSTHSRRGYGPRRRVVCVRGCGVQWRVGVRGYR